MHVTLVIMLFAALPKNLADALTMVIELTSHSNFMVCNLNKTLKIVIIALIKIAINVAIIILIFLT